MGTNYYLHKNECPHCHRSDEPTHIGKSSGGWCFGLHVYPENGIKTLSDWREIWSKPEVIIKNEYGETVSPDGMEMIITKREGTEWKKFPMYGYRDIPDFLEKNHAMPGPKNLVRHKIDQHNCIGHGKGTWDYLVGDFS